MRWAFFFFFVSKTVIFKKTYNFIVGSSFEGHNRRAPLLPFSKTSGSRGDVELGKWIGDGLFWWRLRDLVIVVVIVFCQQARHLVNHEASTVTLLRVAAAAALSRLVLWRGGTWLVQDEGSTPGRFERTRADVSRSLVVVQGPHHQSLTVLQPGTHRGGSGQLLTVTAVCSRAAQQCLQLFFAFLCVLYTISFACHLQIGKIFLSGQCLWSHKRCNDNCKTLK